jgi:hypothetical protein
MTGRRVQIAYHSCNSTVIEGCKDMIRVSQKFIGCQISGHTALRPPLPCEPRSISQALLHDAKKNGLAHEKTCLTLGLR